MSLKKAGLIIIIILLIDQISKIYIKTNFVLGEQVQVFEWFRILFVENEGMAWGARIPGNQGKLLLTLFRLVAIVGIGYWLYDTVQKKGSKMLILSIALIFAGAFGNIIDSVLYGVIFDHSHGQVATLFSADHYGSLLHGKVVDMLYFPIWQGDLPQWIPVWGGQHFTFFEPVFNIADSSITIGFLLMIFFNKEVFKKSEDLNEEEKVVVEENENPVV